MSDSTIGVFWGTFDPPTRAHAFIIHTALKKLQLQTLYVVVNDDTRKTPKASVSERISMLETITQSYSKHVVIQAQNTINQDYFKLRDVLQQPLTVIAGSDALLWLLNHYGNPALSRYDRICIFAREGATIPENCPVETIHLPENYPSFSSKMTRFALHFGLEYIEALAPEIREFIQIQKLYTAQPQGKLPDFFHAALADPYFPRRVSGQKNLLIMPQTKMILRIAPQRFLDAEQEKKTMPAGGAFDNIAQTHTHAVKWQDYYLLANKYPYLRNHGLIVSEAHLDQSVMKQKTHLKALLSLHAQSPELTFFFNHYAGNSQDHFHVHFTSEPLPIQESIEAHIADAHSNQILPFQFNAWQKGLLWYGDQDFIADSLSTKITSLPEDTLYNLVFFPTMQSGIACVALIARGNQRDLIYIKGDNWKMAISASDLMGIFTVKMPCTYNAEQHILHFKQWDKSISLSISELDQALFDALPKTVSAL